MPIKFASLSIFVIAGLSMPAWAQNSPAVLPGHGLKQHSFLYCGEWNYVSPEQTIWLIRQGKPVWSYSIPYHVQFDGKEDFEELGDCSLLEDGSVVFSTRLGASIVSADKKIIWHRDTPPHTELHSIQALPNHRVLIAQNGDPLRLMIIDTQTDKVEKQIDLEAGHPNKPHGQTRRARLTPAGTFLVAHMDRGEVVEYDSTGKPLWTYATKGPWAAVRLPNGNTLITGNNFGYVHEVNAKGEIVWQIEKADLPDYKIGCIQDVVRLKNGNTLFSNWVPNDVKNPADWPTTAQWIEVTPKKKVVWALRQWSDPNLGPGSGIQVLDKTALKQ